MTFFSVVLAIASVHLFLTNPRTREQAKMFLYGSKSEENPVVSDTNRQVIQHVNNSLKVARHSPFNRVVFLKPCQIPYICLCRRSLDSQASASNSSFC